MSPTADHPPLVTPAPLTGRLQGRTPVGRARRALWLLAIGHVATAVATVPITLLVSRSLPDAALSTDPVAGALFLVAGQILSFVKICALARATTDHIDIAQIARSLRRSEWPVVYTLLPAGMQWTYLFATTSAPQLSVLFAPLVGALLLEGISLTWLHHRTIRLGQDEPTAEHLRLPAGTGSRIRALHSAILGTHAVLGGVAAALLVAIIASASHNPAAATPLSTLLQIAASAAATTVPLLPIRGSVLVRAAIAGDTVHDPSLRSAGASFRRAGIAAVPLTAVAVASLSAAQTAPHLAAIPCLIAIVAIGIAATHFIELERFRIGDVPRRFSPKRGRTGASTSLPPR